MGDISPVEDYQEEEDWDDYPNNQLEEVIPDIIDVRGDFLSKLCPLVGVISLEEL
jgi:hypothetical protein